MALPAFLSDDVKPGTHSPFAGVVFAENRRGPLFADGLEFYKVKAVLSKKTVMAGLHKGALTDFPLCRRGRDTAAAIFETREIYRPRPICSASLDGPDA